MKNSTRNYILLLTGIIILGSIGTAITLITDNQISTSGTLVNITGLDASLKMYASAHTNFGANNGESIELWGLTPMAKPYIGWYGWDEATGSYTGVGWIGCHYNLTTGTTHSHCSWETLDNVSGSPQINSHFEILYNGSSTTPLARFPGTSVEVTGSSLTVDSGGTSSIKIDKSAVANFASLTFTNNSNDRWSLQLRNDNTNNLYLRQTNNGVNLMTFDYTTYNITLPRLNKTAMTTGVDGVAYVCVDENGVIFRKNSTCM